MATGSLLHGHGQWMPESFALRREWLSHLLKKTQYSIPPELKHPTSRKSVQNPVDKFRALIENDSTLYMLAKAMFEEIPTKAPYDRDPTTLKKQVRSYKTMLYLFNTLLDRVPEYYTAKNPDIPSGLIGFPYNVILDWPMGTASGRQFFLDPRVNDCLKDILNHWGEFLKSPQSGSAALLQAGWKEAIPQLEEKANNGIQPGDPSFKKFDQLFEYPKGGTPENVFNYGSWDAFFTRNFKEGIRPLPDESAVVVNACESFPIAFDTDVSRRDTFWLKGTPYSLRDMFGAQEDDEAATGCVEKFVGGTVYQAFLSADSYHCWNAPVAGKVIYQKVLPGTYYAETAAAGFGGASGPDPAGPDVSQRYITHVAARGILIIDTKGFADIGLVAFIPVGMSEVSSCDWFKDWTKEPSVQRGELIGAFHGGGSTHCLVFERTAMEKLRFNPRAEYPETAEVNLAVRSELATI